MTIFLRTDVICATLAVGTILTGCNRSSTDAAAAGQGASTSMAAVAGVSGSRAARTSASAGDSAATAGRELVNPDGSTVVFLYYQLAHIPPPIDTWVEADSRVRFAPAPEKAPHRQAVHAELDAAAASVQGVGSLRLTMSANLSDYDPAYGEFTVRALSPSSVVNFTAFDQKVAVNFTNGRTAQIWRVPAEQAQVVRDKIGYNGNVDIDVLLRVATVLPGPAGGTIATDVVEYELRETQRGTVLGRMKVEGK